MPSDRDFVVLYLAARTVDRGVNEMLGLRFCGDQCALPSRRDRWRLRPIGPGNRHGEAYYCGQCGRFIGYPPRR